MTRASSRRRRASVRGPGRYDRSLTTEERRADQRGRLLAAAAEVFAERGFANASVGSIVRRARMSRRTFYEHFADLSDALLGVYDFAVDVLFGHVERRVAAATDPVSRLRAGIAAYLEMYARFADLARVLHREIRAVGPGHAGRHARTVARFAALIRDGVRAAHASGVASRAPDDTTILALVAGIEAVGMDHLDRGDEANVSDAVPPLVDLVVRAFI